MRKKYQLIEPEFLYKLNEEIDILDVGIIMFLIDNLKKDLELKSLPIDIDFVVANYQGNYPTIGIYYIDDSIENVEPIVQNLISNYISEKSMLDFYKYISINEISVIENLEKCKI